MVVARAPQIVFHRTSRRGDRLISRIAVIRIQGLAFRQGRHRAEATQRVRSFGAAGVVVVDARGGHAVRAVIRDRPKMPAARIENGLLHVKVVRAVDAVAIEGDADDGGVVATLERMIGRKVPLHHPIVGRAAQFMADCLNRYVIRSDGLTVIQRLRGGNPRQPVACCLERL